MKLQRMLRQARRLQHAPPQQPHGAELGECREHVLRRRECHAHRAHQMHIVQPLEAAHEPHGISQHRAEFLRIGGALFVPQAPVGFHVRAHVAAVRQFRGLLRVRHGEGHIQPLRIDRLLGNQIGQRHGAAALDPEGDGVQVNALQHPRQLVRREPQPTRGRRIVAHQHEARRAIRKIVQRLGIGARRVGMIHALEQGPRRLVGPRHPRSRDLPVERFEPDPVCGPGDELFLECSALQHGLDAPHPVLT